MTKIKDALTRKIGPLPAWVYLLVFAAAAYWYQSRKQKPQTVLDPATQPGVMDSQTPQDIVPLRPGDSAYNPNTGQLVSTAPEQFPPEPAGPGADRPLPVSLEPGEAVYDPVTGAFLSNRDPVAKASAQKKPAKKKRKAKKKPHHKAKHPVAKHHTPAHKGKKRSSAHLTPGARHTKPQAHKPAPKHRPRSTPPAHKPAPRRPTAHYAQNKPAVRQHAAPTRSAPPAHRPAPRPPARRRR